MLHKRLLLFDIDGTLILSGGKGIESMISAMSVYTGKQIDFSVGDFAGSTDRKIIMTLLAKNGLQNIYQAKDVDAMLAGYLANLRQHLSGANIVEILPGISDLLTELQQNSSVYLGLVTGNMLEGAKIKLEAVNLYHYFPIGGFGSDSSDRNLLPPAAMRRATTHFDQKFASDEVWIIGDTPRDIACAKANQLRSLAVSTGHWSLDQLQAYQPTALMPDLSDTQFVIDTLLT